MGGKNTNIKKPIKSVYKGFSEGLTYQKYFDGWKKTTKNFFHPFFHPGQFFPYN